MRTFCPAHARHITKECNKRQPILLTIGIDRPDFTCFGILHKVSSSAYNRKGRK